MRSAYANGRFPLAQQALVVPGSNGQGIVVRSTFGLLVSRDRGKTFDWVCEETFGYAGAWDPPVAFTGDGTLYVGLENGLATTKDLCVVETVPELAGETVKDLSVDREGTVLVITTTPQKPSALFRKRKNGPFERVGKGLEEAYLVTVDAAPSRPSRIYVTGQPKFTFQGRYYRSDDAGETFVELDQKRTHDGAYFLVGVDPKDPARVVSRFLHFEGSEMTISEDSGKTSKVVLDMKTAMYGAAMNEDGSRIYAGSGLPGDGLSVSIDRGRSYQKLASVGVQCLTVWKDLVFQCENPLTLGGAAFGISEDHGKTFRTVSTFANVRGPLACPSRPSLCQKPWADLSATLAPWRDGGAPPSDAGQGDAASDDAGTIDASTSPAPTKPRGCGGCQASDADPIHGGAFALAVWAMSFVRRARSRGNHGRVRSMARSIGHHPDPADFSRGDR